MMPRRARIMLPGLPFHVLQRGNNRNACFHDEADRAFYLFHLKRLPPGSGCALHAYCLMTNHVHPLLSRASTDSCGQLMQRVAQLHAQYMNRRYARSGTLWEGRFKSCPIEAERYLLHCHRYVELNPVRAGLACYPGDYEWSSFRANAGEMNDLSLIAHEVILALGASEPARHRAYRELFEAPLPTEKVGEIRKATNGNYALGSEAFRRRIFVATGRRASPGKAGRPVAGTAAPGQVGLLDESA